MKCIECHGDHACKVIYYGLPFKLCRDERFCGRLWCHWSVDWLLGLLPFNGWVMEYTGSYLRALITWLFDPEEV